MDYLSKTQHKAKDWDKRLPFFIQAYNGMEHRALGMSPHRAHYGYEIRKVSGSILDTLPNPYQEETRAPHRVHAQHLTIAAEARQKLLEYNAQNLEQTNKERKAVPLSPGDTVFYRPTSRSKLSRPFTGPWKVISITGSTALLEWTHPKTGKLQKMGAHLGNLTRCRVPPGNLGWDARGYGRMSPPPQFADTFAGIRRRFRLKIEAKRAQKQNINPSTMSSLPPISPPPLNMSNLFVNRTM